MCSPWVRARPFKASILYDEPRRPASTLRRHSSERTSSRKHLPIVRDQ
jgi:hypothetical protein